LLKGVAIGGCGFLQFTPIAQIKKMQPPGLLLKAHGMRMLAVILGWILSLAAMAGAEPIRIAVSALPCELRVSGRYILTQDITVPPGKEGLKIMANDIALDLNGCTVSSSSVSGNNAAGITISALKNVSVKNGTIRGFAIGISVIGGGNQELNSAHVFEDLRIVDCRAEGLFLDAGCAGSCVRRCEILGIGPNPSGTAFGLDLRSAGVHVADNRILCTDVGIEVTGAKCALIGNTITAGTCGIYFDGAGDGLRMSNTVIGAATPYHGGQDGTPSP
jgi:hypothetical protein